MNTNFKLIRKVGNLEQYTLIVQLVYWNVTIKIHLIFNIFIKCDNLQFLT